MNEDELKLLILFCRSYHDEKDVQKKTKEFFDRYTFINANVSSSVNVGQIRNIDSDYVYKAGLYEMEVSIKYKNFKSKFSVNDEFKKIGKNWCNPHEIELPYLWLRLADTSILKNSKKQHHLDNDVKYFAFGTAPSMKHFMPHYNYTNDCEQSQISCSFFHNERYFTLYFCVKHDLKCSEIQHTHKFEIMYNAITRVILDYIPSKKVFSFYFFMRHTPIVFREKRETKDEDEEQYLASHGDYQRRKWERSMTFGCPCNPSFCTIEEIGRCPVMRIDISKTRAYGILERLIQRCPSNTYFYFSRLQIVYPSIELTDFEKFPDDEEYFNSHPDKNYVSDVKFACQYAWQVVLERSYEVRDQIILKMQENHVCGNYWENIKNKMKKRIKSEDALVHAMYHISDLIGKHNIFVFENAFRQLFNYYRKNPTEFELPRGMCLVRRVIITPSRLIFLQPFEHFDNRVIRKFGSEHMIRISIQDDNFQKLTFAVQYHTDKEEFLHKIENILVEGLTIGSRKYQVLAASSSQLREHGLYMFAADNDGNTAHTIREWMGDFSNIRNVAKYMARTGQCFSTSDESVQIHLEEDDVISLDDVEHDGFVFSDGCGMISTELANEIRKAFIEKIPIKISDEIPTYNPSAYQIRFKGCKGMVVENPLLPGRKFGKRPSMEKFKCESSSVLEIVKKSAPRTLFLNRPLICLLEQLGVSPKVFMKLQLDMIMDMTDALIYERKAYKMLADRTGLDFPFEKLHDSGICLTEEPFFRRLLLSVYTVGIELLRSKTRIAVPPEKGRNMFGVIDETKTLKYGQVFVQYSEEIGNDYSSSHVLECPVLVTTNPCMHPGDVRKLIAVNVPGLHHIKDCIVFPALGPRPHPDEMAGSDLDGDEYVVIWHEDLIFDNDHQKAMDYPANEEKKLSQSITVPDMIDFLCDYIQNDNVGIMANAFLAWADNDPDGIFSDVCLSLAKKYPRALDFAKSGTTEKLCSNERPQRYPDFMEKGSRKNNYKSKHVLGILYRDTRILEACVSRLDISSQEVTIDKHLSYLGWEQYEESANCYRQKYVKRVEHILKKFGLSNETEALSGCAGKLNEFCENRYDRDNALSIARTYIKETIKRYRRKFEEFCIQELYKKENVCKGSTSELLKILRIIKFKTASAWYIVSYRSENKSVLSFPWVVSDILCDLRKKVLGSKLPSICPKSSFLESSDSNFAHAIPKARPQKSFACKCCLLLQDVVGYWLSNWSHFLKMRKENPFCRHCFERILQKFANSYSCCSYDFRKSACKCGISCSPTNLLIHFLKFYSNEVVSDEDCPQLNCKGFRNDNLQSLALKTYVTLAVSRNIELLTVTEPSVKFNYEEDCEEGDPIKIPVPEDLEVIFREQWHKTENLLRAFAGVKKIFIDGNKDTRGNRYILVNSIGKPHQRWALEELLTNEEILYYVKSVVID